MEKETKSRKDVNCQRQKLKAHQNSFFALDSCTGKLHFQVMLFDLTITSLQGCLGLHSGQEVILISPLSFFLLKNGFNTLSIL
jgi:hypothetical protein